MTVAHALTSVAVAAGCFILSVMAGRYTWRAYCYLFDTLYAERERRRAHEAWLEERRRAATPGGAYVKSVRPLFRVNDNNNPTEGN